MQVPRAQRADRRSVAERPGGSWWDAMPAAGGGSGLLGLERPVRGGAPQGREDQLPEQDELLRQLVVEADEQPVVARDLVVPRLAIDAHHLVELPRREIDPAPVEVLVAGHPAERALDRLRRAAGALDDPLQHAHVLAVPGPQVVALVVLAEP